MLSVISESIKHLCTEVMGLELKKGKSLGKDFYGASLPLMSNGSEVHYYLYLKKETLKEFGKFFLGIDELNEDDLSDFCKESINLIVGKAKATMADANPKIKYQLGTPEYLGKISPPFPVKLDDFLIYKLKNRTFVLGIKDPS